MVFSNVPPPHVNFNHLSDGEFEEFSFDLLASLGLINLSWRRGSGKRGATADQGRDITGQSLERDIDGHARLETWFIQCKRYEAGVPPDKLDGAIAWATAERPDVLLIIASNFLSNPAKTWIDDYQRNNRPPFRIKVWERKDLERFVLSRLQLAQKYRLNTGLPLIETLHPAHILYAVQPCMNSLEYFFEQVERWDASDRDDILSFGYLNLINPRYREGQTGNETMGELRIDAMDYSSFKSKCFTLAHRFRIADEFLVQAIIIQALGWCCSFADHSETQAAVKRNERMIAHASQMLEQERDTTRQAAFKKMIEFSRRLLDSADERRQTAERRYRMLCESLLPALYLEDARPSDSTYASDADHDE